VVGFGDFPLVQRTEPRLTTVRQPVEEMEEASVAWRHVILRTELVVREST
jgi:DNA-binding LacI/PurR family transcriptional regulator